MSTTKTDYPELEKLKKVHKQSQAIGEFLDWLDSQDLCLCDTLYNGEHYRPTMKNTETLLAKFFKINLNKIERERRKMHERLRDQRD